MKYVNKSLSYTKSVEWSRKLTDRTVFCNTKPINMKFLEKILTACFADRRGAGKGVEEGAGAGEEAA